MNQKKYPVKRNEELIVEIENVAFGGKGVCRYDDYVLFIPNTLPGDKVKIRVTRRKAGYGEARILEMIDPSSLRQDPPCKYFEWCGGCTWQNTNYEQQLEFKWNHVSESLNHIADIENINVQNPISAPKVWGYRNKMEFSFSDRRWLLPNELGDMSIDKSFALGLHVPGTFDKILAIDECLLQSNIANVILRYVDQYCRNKSLKPYGIHSHDGFLRFLVIRESSDSGELMVNIVTAYEDFPVLEDLAEELTQKFTQVVSVVNTINEKKAQIAYGEKEHVLFGENFIADKLLGMEFKISANSFFQTNTQQAEKLYRTVIEFAAVENKHLIWDLYSGTGTISLILAKSAKFVTGFELIDSSVKDARKNAVKFGVKNIKFCTGDLLNNLSSIEDQPDTIVTDPPRSGMHPKVTQFLNSSGTQRIVYVSCNPTTMARDLKILMENYRLIKVQPVDMFPQTYHIECVSLLEKR
ncbi:23S rRNA (uracil(1939)-C(5))-methyltransferase RlmD [Calditrichota bacterium]